MLVSIHAPTRGATNRFIPIYYGYNVSIHAPTRGATFDEFTQFRYVDSFNPRTHEGCDFSTLTNDQTLFRFNPRTHEGCDCLCLIRDLNLAVSIHAPTRGATTLNTDGTASGMFQSTHPRGVRHCVYCLKYYLKCFNPRTHEGCDTESLKIRQRFSGFQSTHPRGVRLVNQICNFAFKWFQSTHPRGVRLKFVAYVRY